MKQSLSVDPNLPVSLHPHAYYFGFPILTFPVLIALIAIVGFFIRLSFLNETIYNSDEAYLTIYATKAGRFWTLDSWMDFPWTGLKTSFGFRNPPLFIYMMAPYFTFTTDPRFAMIGLMFFGSLAVVLFGFTVRRVLNPQAGLIAALMVAFLPNAVQHCRQLWGHDAQIFFAALCFFATERSLRDCRARWFVLAILSAAFAQACHMSGMFLWCLPTFAGLAFPRAKFLRILGGEVLIMIFLYTPWLADEAGLTSPKPREEGNFLSIRMMWDIFTGNGNPDPVVTPLHPVWAWFGVLSDSFRLDIIGEYYFAAYYENPLLGSLILIFQYGLGIMMILGFLLLIKDAGKSAKPMLIWGIIATGLAPMLTFSLLPVSSVPLYQLPAFLPACFAVIYVVQKFPAMLLSWSREQFSVKSLQSISVIILLIITVGGGSLHALRTSIVRSKANFTEPLPSTYINKFHALLFCFSIAETSEEIPRTEYTLMQNGRAPDAAIDVWIAALAFSITGDRIIPYNPQASQGFVIVDNATILHPQLQSYLNGLDYTPFKTIRVYRMLEHDMIIWRQLTKQFPSVAPKQS